MQIKEADDVIGKYLVTESNKKIVSTTKNKDRVQEKTVSNEVCNNIVTNEDQKRLLSMGGIDNDETKVMENSATAISKWGQVTTDPTASYGRSRSSSSSSDSNSDSSNGSSSSSSSSTTTTLGNSDIEDILSKKKNLKKRKRKTRKLKKKKKKKKKNRNAVERAEKD
jgi:hypothetical protein